MSSRRTKRAVVGSLMGLGRSKDGAFPKSVLELVASDTFSSLRVRDSKKRRRVISEVTLLESGGRQNGIWCAAVKWNVDGQMRKCCRVCPGWRDEIQLGELCSNITCNVGKKMFLWKRKQGAFRTKAKPPDLSSARQARVHSFDRADIWGCVLFKGHDTWRRTRNAVGPHRLFLCMSS